MKMCELEKKKLRLTFFSYLEALRVDVGPAYEEIGHPVHSAAWCLCVRIRGIAIMTSPGEKMLMNI